jgi:hypothetical protein
MRIRYIFSVISCLLASEVMQAQNADFRITLGGNLRLPGNVSQGMFPIIGFDKDLDKKLLVGGFNGGVSASISLAPHWDLKSSWNLSRQVYWREPMYFTKGPGPSDYLGYINPKTIEYYSSLSGIVHFVPKKKFSIGAGLGFQLLLASFIKVPSPKKAGTIITGALKSSEYKPLLPIVPIEFSWKEERFIYNIRYEAGLLNRYRGDVADYGKNIFHALYFEVGLKI